jgi:hypothetical protein
LRPWEEDGGGGVRGQAELGFSHDELGFGLVVMR